MDNNFYKKGSLWRTRKQIDAFICSNQPDLYNKIIKIPKNEFVMLLHYEQSSSKNDNISILWRQKILYCIDIDIGHSFLLG